MILIVQNMFLKYTDHVKSGLVWNRSEIIAFFGRSLIKYNSLSSLHYNYNNNNN